MQITNWFKWQTYRKDRGTPPWIKVYRSLLSNTEWVSLSDSEKGQLVSLWILAADKFGEIPDNAVILQKMCMLDKAPNIKKFKDLGFLVTSRLPVGDQVVSVNDKLDAPETETETETYSKETETKTETKTDQEPTLITKLSTDLSAICPFNIELFLTDKLRTEIKMTDCPHLDFSGAVIPAYNKFMANKKIPDNPIGSFRGFAKKFYKDYVGTHGIP